MVGKVNAAPPSAIRELSRVPGVGPSIAASLYSVGIRQLADLRGRSPERLYAALCKAEGGHVDRCVLYVFRCAVYFASQSRHDPELLKWWNWKDGAGAVKGAAGKQSSRCCA